VPAGAGERHFGAGACYPSGTRDSPLYSVLTFARRRLRRVVLLLGAAWIAAFLFAQELAVLLAQPLVTAWNERRSTLGAPALHFRSLIEPFWTSMSLAFWAGVIISAPIVFYQVWRGVTRARAPARQNMALPFAVATAACFAGGALFCYFVVLPVAFDFLLGFTDDNLASMSNALGVEYQIGEALALQPALLIDPYISLTIRLLLAFGLVFELPIAIFFLASIGVVTHRGLWRFNRWAVVLAFVIGAILTPSPDVLSQVLMAGPLLVLYNLSIIIAWLLTRRRERAMAG
jgi:sec-independent protein translocase protein TatC